MFLIKWIQNTKWLTVGMKILAGVSIASNIFIGGLLYFNLNSSTTVEQTVNQVLEIREKLSSNLRGALVELQNQFLSLPQFFHINPHAKIIETINSDFKIISKNTIEGRESYTNLFSRNERRDLAKRQFVVKQQF